MIKQGDYERVGIVLAILGVIYMIGKKEGHITSEVQQNRVSIDQILKKVDDMSEKVSWLTANAMNEKDDEKVARR